MHAALLLGYGASAINPYLSFAIISSLTHGGKMQLNYATARANYIEAMKKGLLKIMAKMGISTIRSYRGARIFECVGLDEGLLREYFGTDRSTIGGIGLETIARDAMWFHAQAYDEASSPEFLPYTGLFHYRKDGIRHAWNPETISSLQISTRLGSYQKFKDFTAAVDGKAEPIFLRDLLDFKRGTPVSIDEVEPVEARVVRTTNAITRTSRAFLCPVRPSRSLPDASASRRNTWSTQRRSRLRSPRARNPVRAASFRDSRSTTSSQRPGTPSRASR